MDNADLIGELRLCAHIHPQFGYPENGKLYGRAATALEAAQAELAEAREWKRYWAGEMDTVLAHRKDAEAERDRLAALVKEAVEWFRKGGRHDGLCALIGGYGYCSCGLDAILAKLEGKG